MSKLITVFGATGNQGGSVVKALLADRVLSRDFRIRGITRDTSKPAAQSLANQGVELMSADMDSPASLSAAVKGAHTVFLVTNFWESGKADVELQQGKNVADAAKSEGVQHLIFSALINVTRASGGKLAHVTHFDSKANIEAYIRESGIPATFVLPGYFMSNIKQTLKKQDDGSYLLPYPVGKDAKFPLFDSGDDTGKFVTAAIRNRDHVLGKQIYEAADYYTPERIADEFTQVTGKKATYVQIPQDKYLSMLPAAVGREFLENHLLLENPGYYAGADLKESLSLLGDEKPTTWKDFVAKNKDTWQ